MRKFILLGMIVAFSSSCDKDDDKKGTVSARIKSLGTYSPSGLYLSGKSEDQAVSLYLADESIASSNVTITSLKVPIVSINLAKEATGTATGYLSENFYTCDDSASTCMIELTDGSVESLLEGSAEMTIGEDAASKPYDTVTIGTCSDTQNGTHQIEVVATVVMDGVTYYTKATGLSTESPAEVASIPTSCLGSGITGYLYTPVVMSEENPVSIIIHANPNGMINATRSKTLMNSNCLGEETLAICSGMPAMFATVDTTAPTLERFMMTTTDTRPEGSTSVPYASLIATALFNSDNLPIGGLVQQYYAGNKNEARNLASIQMIFSQVQLSADGTLDFGYGDSGSFFKGLSRTGTTTGIQPAFPDTSSLTYSATRL